VHIRTLSFSNFRNYSALRIEASPAPVVLTGRNGVGKTNILEAVSLLTPGRGLRRAKVSELDNQRQGGMPWALSATICGMQGETQIGTGRDSESDIDKRIVKIDGKIVRSQTELARHMAALWLTPQMEQLFQEGASAGRKFLDRLVYSFDSGHASRVNEYEFAMRERNKVLAIGTPDPHWLDALEQTMAETGTAIASARILACEHINMAVQNSPLSFPKAHMEIKGFIEDKLTSGEAAITIEEMTKKALWENRRQDAAAGRAMVGPHRSEMKVIHIEKQMLAEFCSTGEQKALLLSIVLAQARAGAKWHGVVPVLLLDEVAAHLDATKRLELFQEIDHIKAQVWMTGTDIKLFEGMEGKAQYFKVENGEVLTT
jgi:DNA replication and repair protein RecF